MAWVSCGGNEMGCQEDLDYQRKIVRCQEKLVWVDKKNCLGCNETKRCVLRRRGCNVALTGGCAKRPCRIECNKDIVSCQQDDAGSKKTTWAAGCGLLRRRCGAGDGGQDSDASCQEMMRCREIGTVLTRRAGLQARSIHPAKHRGSANQKANQCEHRREKASL